MTFIQKIARYDDPTSIGARFRAKRSERICTLIETTFAQKGCCHIIDIGGEARYWNILSNNYLRNHNVKVTIVNREARRIGEPLSDLFETVEGDGCDLPFADNEFDISHSNSVIEHVGPWSNVQAFARETMRVAPLYYVQVPHFWFPFEPHFGTLGFHWLPQPIQVSMVLRKPCGQFDRAEDLHQAMMFAEDARLFDRRMLLALFPKAEIVVERFFGLPKSLMAIGQS